MGMKKPIAIVLNPKAGKGQAEKICQAIIHALRKLGHPFEIFRADWPVDFQSFGSVWIVGGDGTLNYLVNHATGPLPPMVIFKGGTGNDFARHLYGEADTGEIIRIALGAAPRPVDAGICNGQYFLNTIGVGFDGKVLRSMTTIRWLGSFLGYYTAIIKNIFSFREPLFRLEISGKPVIQGRFLLVQVSNAPTTGGGFKVSPLANIQDGQLNLLTCRPLNFLKRFFVLPAVRKGKHLSFPFVEHKLIQQVSIDAAMILPAQVDGELIEASRFDCVIIPDKFLFIF